MSTIDAQLEIKDALRKTARAYRTSPDAELGVAAGMEELRLLAEIAKLRKRQGRKTQKQVVQCPA